MGGWGQGARANLFMDTFKKRPHLKKKQKGTKSPIQTPHQKKFEQAPTTRTKKKMQIPKVVLILASLFVVVLAAPAPNVSKQSILPLLSTTIHISDLFS